jgi:hypothetical protein
MNKNIFLNIEERLKQQNYLFDMLLMFKDIVLITFSVLPSVSLFLYYIGCVVSLYN